MPGGFAALAFIARGKLNSTPNEFLADYARAILANSGTGPGTLYIASVREYFDRLGALLELSTRSPGKAAITLSLADNVARRKTEKVLSLLGWKLNRDKDRWTIQAGSKASQVRRQDVASALAVDEVAMQKAFSAGQSYELTIPFEWAAIALDETAWRSQFYPDEKWSGGFAEALARLPHLAPGVSRPQRNGSHHCRCAGFGCRPENPR